MFKDEMFKIERKEDDKFCLSSFEPETVRFKIVQCVKPVWEHCNKIDVLKCAIKEQKMNINIDLGRRVRSLAKLVVLLEEAKNERKNIKVFK